MNTMHPDEQAIQLYASDPFACSIDIRNHIAACEDCIAQTALYTQLFSTLREQPAAGFDFDLAGLVLQQLPKSKPSWSPIFIITILLTAIATAFAGWLFRKELLQLFTGIVPVTLYLIVIVTAAIALLQAVEMYRKYEKMINAVNK